MQRIIYYVSTSIDGFIAGENDDVSQFIHQGKGVEKYLADLSTFKTVIMGRKTYELGYAYGIKPGQPAYPDMEHFIFSDHLTLENPADTVHVRKMELDALKEIRKNATTDIYMCGGGKFAEWLLNNGQIDQIKLKVNPIVLGKGVKLFGELTRNTQLKLVDHEPFDDGMLLLTYDALTP